MEYTPSPALFEAAAYLSSAPSLAKVSSSIKLELYGLYKYLTVASVPQNPRPSLFDLTGRAKWDAWSNIGKTYAGQGPGAERRYLDIARELGWVPGAPTKENKLEKDIAPDEVWDDDLGVSVSVSAEADRGGMGASVSAMAVAADDDEDAAGHPLHAFAIEGDVNKITQFLKENVSVDINQRDGYGYTPLQLACDRGNLPVVKVLVENDADPMMKDPDDLTAIELAQIAGHDEICTFLRS